MTMSKGRILHTGQFGSLLTHWFERTLPTLIIPKNVYCGVMTSSAKPGPPIAWSQNVIQVSAAMLGDFMLRTLRGKALMESREVEMSPSKETVKKKSENDVPKSSPKRVFIQKELVKDKITPGKKRNFKD
nr:hypothetical protein BgiMline_013552 [Biomphalaria glabrata]